MSQNETRLIANEESRNIETEKESSVTLPLLASWVALVAFVGAMSGLTGPIDTDSTQFRKLQIKRAINSTANPCTSFYNYSCGNYPLYNALTPWESKTVISNRIVAESPAARHCFESNFFESDDAWFEPLESSARDNNCNMSCKLSLLDLGLAVNGVISRVTLTENMYKLVYFSYTGNQTNSTPSWGEENAEIRSSDVESRLQSEDNVTVDLPADFPTNCIDALKRYRLNYVQSLFKRPSLKLVTMIKNIKAKAAAHFPVNKTPPTILIGGGEGIVEDIELASNSMSWLTLQERQRELVGTPVGLMPYETAASVVNAFFDADSNTVHIPSAITQEPFYHDTYSDDLAYGGLGFIVAHELGHAIDHARNNTMLRHRVGHLLSHMSKETYKTVSHTEKEAVADYYGLRLVEETTGLSNFTALQMAQMWCLSSSSFTNDSHPPGRWRVNVTMSNSTWWRSTYC